MEKVNAVSVILFCGKGKNRKFLILKYCIHNQNHWDFVKGKVKESESLKDACIREVNEETGIRNFNFIDFEDSYTYDFEKDTGEEVNKTVTFFVGELEEL